MKPSGHDIAWAVASNCCLFLASYVYAHFCDVTFPRHVIMERCIVVCGCYYLCSCSVVVWKSEWEEFEGLHVNNIGKWMGKVIACLVGMILDSSFPDTSAPAILVSFLLWAAILCGKQVMQPNQDLGFLDMTVTMVAAKGYGAFFGSLVVFAIPFVCGSMVAVEVLLQKYWARNQN